MPYVVKEPRRGHKKALIRVKVELSGHHPCKVHRPEGVLEPGMVGAGVYEVGEPELPHVPEPLHGSRVKETDHGRRDFHVAMHRVLYDLHAQSETTLFSPSYK